MILDEADKLLNIDFDKSLSQLLLTINEDRQTMLFSATMTSNIYKLTKIALKNPVKIELSIKS